MGATAAGSARSWSAGERRPTRRRSNPTPLWAAALRTVRHPEDAPDVQVTTWLHRVVVTACLDRLRALKVRPVDPLPDDLDRDPDLGATDDPAVASQERTDVAVALGRLNPDHRAALVLVDMQGYSVEEASLILGCAPGTVKSRCARGRVRLAPLLADLAPVTGRGR